MQSPFESYLHGLYQKYRSCDEGAVATYIPELANADPNAFGISLATIDGTVYEVGDSRRPFTIQSISKPLTYGIALEDCGRPAVMAKVGVEPSGEAFNSISLAPGSGRPLNPMINAGAIAATSFIAGYSQQDREERLLAIYSLYAGRCLSLDNAVYESERTTGHRNRAIGHLLRNFNILESDPEPILDLYFRQCSVSVTCRDLSVMAATLANGGTNPLTGERAIRAEYVEDILSVMTTCGMYDYAGQWVYAVGMPAKSGVAGGVLVVLPGQFGIGVFSPRLDALGNSVRGVRVCEDLSRDLQLHFLRVARSSKSAIRAQFTLATARSKRRRADQEVAVLDDYGHRIRVYELQGDFLIPAIEAVVRSVLQASADLDVAVLDLTRVSHVAAPAVQFLLELLRRLHDGERHLVLVTGGANGLVWRALEEQNILADKPLPLIKFADADAALEWCETQLVAWHLGSWFSPAITALHQHELCAGLDPDELAHLEGLLLRRCYSRGEMIVRMGDYAEEVFLLMSGEVSVVMPAGKGRVKRLSTLSGGMAFGELAIVRGGPRSADVQADQPVDCFVLSREKFDTLSETHPRLKIKLLENMLISAHSMVSRLNHDVELRGR